MLSPNNLKVQLDDSGSSDNNGAAESIKAVEETANKATEAASELVSWISSGKAETFWALGILLACLVLLLTARWLFKYLLPRVPRKDDYSLAAVLTRIFSRVRLYFLVALAFRVTDWFIDFPEQVSTGIDIVFVIAAVLQSAEIVQEVAVSWIRRSVARKTGDTSTLASAINVVKVLVTFLIWAIAILLLLDNIGANVTTLLAGLGIGGIAIGLASQGIFRDLFSALSIIFDRPFQKGDRIRYGDSWGTIEDIGLKTTRIRSMKGEQIIISNTNLLDHEIHNMKRMSKRRIETGFGITYSTPPELAEKAIGIASEAVKSIKGLELEYCTFAGFGDSSLDYELVFYSSMPEYVRSKGLKGKVLMEIFKKFNENGIDFAFPTQTLHIASLPDELSPELLESVLDAKASSGKGPSRKRSSRSEKSE